MRIAEFSGYVELEVGVIINFFVTKLDLKTIPCTEQMKDSLQQIKKQ